MTIAVVSFGTRNSLILLSAAECPKVLTGVTMAYVGGSRLGGNVWSATDTIWMDGPRETSLMRMATKVAGWMLGLIGIAVAAAPIGPLVTGTVFDNGLILGRLVPGNGDPAKIPRELSGPQLRDIYSWIDAHQSNLHMILASPPPPSSSVVLSDTRGRRIQIDLYSVNESWKHAVQISVRDVSGKFVYGGEMSLPSADIAALREMLKLPA